MSWLNINNFEEPVNIFEHYSIPAKAKIKVFNKTISGDTYAIKGALKAEGCKFDGSNWIASSKVKADIIYGLIKEVAPNNVVKIEAGPARKSRQRWF